MRLTAVPRESWVIFAGDRAMVFKQVDNAYRGHLDVPMNLSMGGPEEEKAFVVEKAGQRPVSAPPNRKHVYDVN